MSRRPNIVFCMCDQLRAFETGCYGSPTVQTPNVDRLASQGTRFETAVSNNPVCMPARSIVLSGQYSRTCASLNNFNVGGLNGMPEYPFPDRPHLPQQTLPETLREAGYHTAAIGKWHVHSWPHDIGFDHYLIPRVHHCHSGQSYTENGGIEFVPDDWSVDFESNYLADYLEGLAGSDQPFYLYYNISPPHMPVADMPDEFLRMYSKDQVELRPNVPDSIHNADWWFRVYRWDFRHYRFGLPEADEAPADFDLRDLIALYWGATTWMDAAVGRMLDELDRHGLADDTVVVFCSDHGDMLGSHDRFNKGCHFEEATRVPMMLRGPGVQAGAVNTQQVASLVDLPQTLLDLAGVDAPGHMQGQSLAPICRGERDALDRPHAFVETQADGIGIRTPTHSLSIANPRDAEGLPVHRELADHPQRFFDLTRDPYERSDLSQDPSHASLRNDLLTHLHDWHHATPWRDPTDQG